MRVTFKPVGEQVIVITGASSGIGLRRLAAVGATVALLDRAVVFGGDD
jgi:NADP-dependent 3-hydroxy acid dehydrogenase YdfG